MNVAKSYMKCIVDFSLDNCAIVKIPTAFPHKIICSHQILYPFYLIQSQLSVMMTWWWHQVENDLRWSWLCKKLNIFWCIWMLLRKNIGLNLSLVKNSENSIEGILLYLLKLLCVKCNKSSDKIKGLYGVKVITFVRFANFLIDSANRCGISWISWIDRIDVKSMPNFLNRCQIDALLL